MPGRSNPLVTGEMYHVFNRGIDRRPTYTDKREYQRALRIISYYRFIKPIKKLSYFLLLSSEVQMAILQEMRVRNEKLVEILAFCLMPNHFHFLLKQLHQDGISKFIGNMENSYTRYYNTKNNRVGPLFLNQFKAIRIETYEQLLHVSRYIHLNPLTSFVIKDFSVLMDYPWSSLGEYMNMEENGICDQEIIMNSFKDKKAYSNFIKDQIDYQRTLHLVKHLAFDD